MSSRKSLTLCGALERARAPALSGSSCSASIYDCVNDDGAAASEETTGASFHSFVQARNPGCRRAR